ncbi:MAG: NYN domain-containing protein [Patescibacteria group bacterium]
MKESNIAYIDGANLHNGVNSLGWRLDYARFRVWLTDKYNVDTAYIFLGLIPKYSNLYKYLQEIGFTLVFKEVIYDDGGKPKGNCDADLVLNAVCDAYEKSFNKAVLVTSDGDYAGLVKFLQKKNKLLSILSPRNSDKCSILLKRTNAKISYINDQRTILEIINEKAPGKDETLQGSSSW